MIVLREMVVNLLIFSEAMVLKFIALKVMLFESQDTSQEFIQLMLSIVYGFIWEVPCLVSALLLLPSCLTFVSNEWGCFIAVARCKKHLLCLVNGQ